MKRQGKNSPRNKRRRRSRLGRRLRKLSRFLIAEIEAGEFKDF